MKNSQRALLMAAMVFAAANAYADSADGPYVGGGIGMYTATANVGIPASNVNIDLGSSGTDTGVAVYAGYKHKMGDGSVAGELSFNSGIGKNGHMTVPGASNAVSFTNNVAVSVLPGYNLTPDTTSYLRLGYAQAKMDSKGTTAGVSHTFTGYVVGFGVDQAFRPNLSARLEYRMLSFSSWTDPTGSIIKPTASGMDITVRYAF